MNHKNTVAGSSRSQPTARSASLLGGLLALALLSTVACSSKAIERETTEISSADIVAPNAEPAASPTAGEAIGVLEEQHEEQDGTPEVIPSASDFDSPEPTATGTAAIQTTVAPAIHTAVWKPAEELPPAFTLQLPTDEQIASAGQLEPANPSLRDEIELARIYGGWSGTLPEPPLEPPALEIDTRQNMTILNTDLNVHNTIEVELLAKSEHAYFWFDTASGSNTLSLSELENIAGKFDEIYETITALFGSEANPGIDGDSRLHIVNASPLAMCDVTEEDTSVCRTAGYFDHSNTIPTEIDPNSNAREMFVMNADYIGRDFYFNVLAHELRHMIEHNQDQGEIDWVAEGGAMLAEELLGYPEVALRRGNLFLADPDQQLNSWSADSSQPHYGQGYLLNRYMYDRLGPELYFRLSSSPETGLRGIDAASGEVGLDIRGEDLWLDWLAALAIHDHTAAPEPFLFNFEGLNVVSMTSVVDLPVQFAETVHQFAADYYLYEGQNDLHIDFQGSTLVPVNGSAAASGSHMWMSDRANFRHMHLSRSFDLSEVDQATLSYKVFHDIEAGYDFAYVFVSADGGRTWKSLVADNMRGLDPEDDPANSALASRFYSGQSDGWLEEEISLSPFTGQEIMIRFAYVTDQILTSSGIAFDDISIPEVGFFDDGESLVDGWESHGFHRVAAAIPQNWQLQLITFSDDGPTVQLYRLPADGSLQLIVPAAETNGRAIIIISATAPQTLQPAHYRLSLSN